MGLHEYMKRVVEQREVLSRSQARALVHLMIFPAYPRHWKGK